MNDEVEGEPKRHWRAIRKAVTESRRALIHPAPNAEVLTLGRLRAATPDDVLEQIKDLNENGGKATLVDARERQRIVGFF